MSTLLHRLGMPAFGTQNCSTTAALLLIRQLDQRDLQQDICRDVDDSLRDPASSCLTSLSARSGKVMRDAPGTLLGH